MAKFYKEVESTISAKQETSTLKSLNGTSVSYTKCNRTSLTTKEANYFSSFNLPYQASSFTSGTTLANFSPELYQLNVDEIVIIPIGNTNYNEIIDGRSITLSIPQIGAGSGMSAKTVVSTTYSVLQKKQTSPLVGNNVAFLFSDDINIPYTGTTDKQTIDHVANTTWNTSSYLTRPSAVAYSDLNTDRTVYTWLDDRNSDTRPWSSVKKAVDITESYPNTFGTGYNYDIPVGFVALDKGYIVLTHPEIINYIPWSGGSKMHLNGSGVAVDDGANTGASSGTTNIYFSSTTNSSLSFYDLNTEFKTAIVCLAMPGEFFLSTNPTWSLEKNAEEYKNGSNNLDKIYPTEIGLYNLNQELIAIAKIDRPTEKKITNIITFNLEIDV